jgi:hypothetical protein
MSDGILFASSTLGLGAISAFSIPAIVSFIKQVRDRNPKTDGYEDKDGRSSEEALKAFGAKRPKAAILTLSVIGLCTSVAIGILSTLSPNGKGDGLFLENWLVVPGWVS